MEPTGSGMGGDIFAIVWDGKTKQLYGLNGSGRSPKSLTREMMVSQGLTKIPSHGPLPVSVPGCVDGWFTLHERFGKLPMKRVLAPAIAYAKDGFPVSELIAYYWDRSVTLFAADPKRFPNFVETYTIDGHAPRAGQIFKNPALARTLEIIAKKGRAGFYEGEVNHRDLHARRKGLPHARGLGRAPLRMGRPGFDQLSRLRHVGAPPNSQGIATLEILNILGLRLRRSNSVPTASITSWR
jgi:gamma-glutamyltranspeptidase/glutathione hydrolase